MLEYRGRRSPLGRRKKSFKKKSPSLNGKKKRSGRSFGKKSYKKKKSGRSFKKKSPSYKKKKSGRSFPRRRRTYRGEPEEDKMDDGPDLLPAYLQNVKVYYTPDERISVAKSEKTTRQLNLEDRAVVDVYLSEALLSHFETDENISEIIRTGNDKALVIHNSENEEGALQYIAEVFDDWYKKQNFETDISAKQTFDEAKRNNFQIGGNHNSTALEAYLDEHFPIDEQWRFGTENVPGMQV